MKFEDFKNLICRLAAEKSGGGAREYNYISRMVHGDMTIREFWQTVDEAFEPHCPECLSPVKDGRCAIRCHEKGLR